MRDGALRLSAIAWAGFYSSLQAPEVGPMALGELCFGFFDVSQS